MTGEEIKKIVEDTRLKANSISEQTSVPEGDIAAGSAEENSEGALVLVPENACYPDQESVQRILGEAKVTLAGCGNKSLSGCKCQNAGKGTCARSQLDLLEGYDGIYLYSPGFAMIKRIVQLNDDELVVRMLFQGVLSGKKAGIIFKGDADSLPQGLRRHLKTITDELKSLGIQIYYGSGCDETGDKCSDIVSKTLFFMKNSF